MKKFLTILGYTALGIVVLLYLSFLFILPNAVDINKFKPEIQKIAQEQAGLNIDFENAKIITTPLLGAGIKADKNKGKEQALEKTETEVEEAGWFNPAWIRIKIPCVKLNNYKILVNDLASGHY